MTQVKYQNKYLSLDFPGGAVHGNQSASAWDMGSIPGPGRFHKAQGNVARAPQVLKPARCRARALQQEKAPQWEACMLKLQKARGKQQRCSADKNNFNKINVYLKLMSKNNNCLLLYILCDTGM